MTNGGCPFGHPPFVDRAIGKFLDNDKSPARKDVSRPRRPARKPERPDLFFAVRIPIELIGNRAYIGEKGDPP